jgi:hypothetical protein
MRENAQRHEEVRRATEVRCYTDSGVTQAERQGDPGTRDGKAGGE